VRLWTAVKCSDLGGKQANKQSKRTTIPLTRMRDNDSTLITTLTQYALQNWSEWLMIIHLGRKVTLGAPVPL